MKVAYQGQKGSYSHLAVNSKYKKANAIGYATFEEVLDAVVKGVADIAFLPVENSTAGRVANAIELLPKKNLKIIGEYFFKVNHCLIGQKNASIKDVEEVYSHPQALAQCSKFIKKNKYNEVPFGDTASAVEYILQLKDNKKAAIASELAAKIYGGKILKRNINNQKTNTTRFLILSKNKKTCKGNCLKALFFETKNEPAALFKALSGFATEYINIVKLESFVSHFNGAARFYIEFEKPKKQASEDRALNVLKFFSTKVFELGEFKREKLNL